ncbi:MAG TPA: phosphatase PAP2 family protein [Sediminibacterium sp.]|nr:phosphatase PAP2 family protein [Sediminibacterium sp.]
MLVLSAVIGITLIGLSGYFGRVPVFLALNGNLGHAADICFTYITQLGNGLVWIPVVLLAFRLRPACLPLVLSLVVFSTLFTQVPKNLLFSHVMRPSAVITDPGLLHTVPGVELHQSFSFPSGHTATAFSIVFLVTACFPKRKWLAALMLVYGLAVGYSRVYLAQHFPIDVGGGIIAAIISYYASWLMQGVFDEKRKRPSA